MTLAETYATRYAEGDKSWDSLVMLFNAALAEAANRERARCMKAIQTLHETDAETLDDLPTWEVRDSYIAAIQQTKI